MLEIFIPTKIKNKNLEINNISKNFIKVLKESFKEVELTSFDSKFFEWIKLFSKNLDKDLVILCNWEFWENYFIDYDFTKNLEEIWTKILWENKIQTKIEEIEINISEITQILKSNKLLTNSKKQEILNKIKQSFFALSWVIFLLYSLKQETQKNFEELNNYSWNIEYEAQAEFLKETSLTKNIELQASIDKLEDKVEMFIWVISNFI